MRPEAIAVLVALTAVPLTACKKSGSSASGDGGSTSSASSGGSGSSSSDAPLASGFEGDVTMHITAAKTSAPPMDVTFHIKGNKFRVDVPAHNNEQAHVVFDQGTQKTYVILDSQKMYLETDHQLQKTFPGPRPLPAQITETGKHETIAGTDCEDWEIVEPLGKHANVCIAKGIAFFDFGASRPMGGMPQRGWMDELRMKQAFPLRAVETDSAGKEITRMEVTKIEKKSLDDSLFAIPAGYKSMPTVRPGDFPMPSMPSMPAKPR